MDYDYSNESAKDGHLGYKSEDLLIINTILLGKYLSHQTNLILLNGSIELS